MTTLLTIFAKEPVPGQVKTRLTPPLTPDAAARVYHWFLEDILEEMGRLPGFSLALAYHPAAAAAFFRNLAPGGALLLPQEGPGLGERLVQAFGQGFALGFETVLVRNSDSPNLPGEIVLAAAQTLKSGQADLVLGPNPDGGYYLVGLQSPRPELFQGIPWSTPGVLPATLKKAQSLRLAAHLLPPWPDIDTIDDLRAFAARPPLPDGPGGRSYAYIQELLAGLPTKNLKLKT